jgi:hypothetical protein
MAKPMAKTMFDEVVDVAVRDVMAVTCVMTRKQAVDFLEDVISRLEDSAEEIREEIG